MTVSMVAARDLGAVASGKPGVMPNNVEVSPLHGIVSALRGIVSAFAISAGVVRRQT